MPYFVQYDNTTGDIVGIVLGQHAPNHPHQLTSQDPVDPQTKKVNLQKLTIEDKPLEPVDPLAGVKAQVLAAQEFGRDLITDYSVTNALRGLTTSQVATISEQFNTIFVLLNSGALLTAKEMIDQIEAGDLVGQQDKDFFITKINDYLGL